MVDLGEVNWLAVAHPSPFPRAGEGGDPHQASLRSAPSRRARGWGGESVWLWLANACMLMRSPYASAGLVQI